MSLRDIGAMRRAMLTMFLIVGFSAIVAAQTLPQGHPWAGITPTHISPRARDR